MSTTADRHVQLVVVVVPAGVPVAPVVGEALAERLSRSLLYEDDVLLVYNKPAGLAVHGGSGISLGHPVGATGVIIAEKALSELERTGGRYAVVTMCIGGGQGIAGLFERLDS